MLFLIFTYHIVNIKPANELDAGGEESTFTYHIVNIKPKTGEVSKYKTCSNLHIT